MYWKPDWKSILMMNEKPSHDLADQLNRFRFIPRLLVIGYSVLFYEVAHWFMTLPEPNNAQSAFISVMSATFAAVLKFYVESGPTHNND